MVAFNLKLVLASAALAMASAASPACAQYIGSNSAEYNAGYGRYPGQENQVPNYGTRDASGNRVIVDGMILSGDDQSVYSNSSSSSSSGVSSSSSGVGSWGGGATAIGNNLVVVTQGNYNTVIVTSTQTNNGAVTANTTNGVGNAN